MNTQKADVALILWNPDVIEWVSFVLGQQNLKCFGLEPDAAVEEMEHLIASRGPRVVVFDLCPPYQRSASVFLRLIDRFPDRSFLVTCADPGLAVKAAPWLACHPILQKPYPPDVIGKVIVSSANRTSVLSARENTLSLDLHLTFPSDLFSREGDHDRFPN